MENDNFGTRLAVLEVKVENHAEKLEDVTSNLATLNREVNTLITSVTNLNSSVDRAVVAIERVSTLASDSNSKWTQFNSYVAGGTKVITIVGLAGGIIWTLFTFFYNHK